MDQFPIRQTLELGKSISTGEKSILNLVKLSSLVIEYCNRRVLYYSPVKFENFVYFCTVLCVKK